MGTFLLDRQVAVAYFHHVHVVMRIEVNGGQVANVFLDDRFYVLPSWADIDTWSPRGRLVWSATIARTSNLLACARNDPMSARLSMIRITGRWSTYDTSAPSPDLSLSPDAEAKLHWRIIFGDGGADVRDRLADTPDRESG